MKIRILGAGNMGSALATQLVRAGHEVQISARSLEKAQAVATATGARAVPADAPPSAGTVVILATGYADAVKAGQQLGTLSGTVVIDITNPLTADYMGLTLGHSTSAAEEIAKAFPGAEVVKGFNTLFAQVLADGPAFAGGQVPPVFVASDSARAKQAAVALAESIGYRAVDAGALKNARYLEPLAGLNIYLGYGAGLGTAIAPTWIAKAA